MGAIKAEYLLEYSVSPELEQEYNQSDCAVFERAKAAGDIAATATMLHQDYNQVATCRYQRQGNLWREDVSEAYPGGLAAELLDHSQEFYGSEFVPTPSSRTPLLNHFEGFDGEKYFAYAAARSRGIIARTAEDIKAVTGPYANVSNGIRFLGLSEPVTDLEEGQKFGVTLRPSGQEQVNGEPCVKYVAKSLTPNGFHTRYTIWISLSKGYAVIKWQSEIFVKKPQSQLWNASVTIGNAYTLEKTASGVYVNKVYKEDEFRTKGDGKLHWQDSWRFTLANLQLGAEIPRAVFAVQFPPGARIMDTISSPGRINIVGAEFGTAAEQMSRGTKIKLEALNGTSAPQPQPGEEFHQLVTP